VIQPHPQHPQHSSSLKTVPFILLGVLASTDMLVIGALPSKAELSVQAANTESTSQVKIQNTCSLESFSAPATLSEAAASPPSSVTVQHSPKTDLPMLQNAMLPNPPSDLLLADNTPVKLKFKEEISSKKVKQSQVINLEVSEDVVVQDVTVIEKGAKAKGCVAEVKRARMMGRKGKLSIVLTEVQLVSGEMIALHGTDSKEGGVAAARMALSSIVAPFFLLMAGKEAKYPAGTELTAFVDGDRPLNPSQFVSEAAPKQD
jgi:hypothetical protein